MITIRIAEAVRSLENIRDIDESWINQQINRRRADNHSVCVQLSIKEGPLNMQLFSAGCTSSGVEQGSRINKNSRFSTYGKRNA